MTNAYTDGAEVALSEAIERNRDMANLIASYGGVLPIHCVARGGDIVTLAAVLHENPKLALSAIYIPNPQSQPGTAATLLGPGLPVPRLTHRPNDAVRVNRAPSSPPCYRA